MASFLLRRCLSQRIHISCSASVTADANCNVNTQPTASLHSIFKRALSLTSSSSSSSSSSLSSSSCSRGKHCSPSSLCQPSTIARQSLLRAVHASFSSSSSASASSTGNGAGVDGKASGNEGRFDPDAYRTPSSAFDVFPFNDPFWQHFVAGDGSGATAFYNRKQMTGPRYYQRRIEGTNASEQRSIEETIDNLNKATHVCVNMLSEQTTYLEKFMELQAAWIKLAVGNDLYEARVEDRILQIGRIIENLMVLKRPHFASDQGKIAENKLRALIEMAPITYWANKGDITENVELIERAERRLDNVISSCPDEVNTMHFSCIVQAYLGLHTVQGSQEYWNRAQRRISQAEKLLPGACQLPPKSADQGWFYIESAIIQSYLDSGKKDEIEKRLAKMGEKWRAGFQEMIDAYEDDVAQEKKELERRKEVQQKYPPTTKKLLK